MSGSKIVNNPLGAFGVTDLQSKLPSLEGEFLASAAITAPKVVSISTAGSVATCATDATASLAVGVAIKDAAASGRAKVVTYGIAENVPAAGAVAAGDLLKRSVTTAGYVSATATPGVGEAIGVAINASSSNTVDVWVCKGL